MERDDWDQRYAGKELTWSAGPSPLVATVLGDLASGRALDLAAGEGRHAIWLAGRGWQVTAVDFSRTGLSRARALAAARDLPVRWLEADVRTYQPEPDAFDLVLVAYLHLPSADGAAVWRRAAAALAPGGRLLVVGHDRANRTDGIGGPQDPDVLYTPEEVAAALPGLRILRAERVLRTVEHEEHAGAAIDALVLATRP